MTALLFLSFSAAVFLEFLLRAHGIPLPLTALCVFYFTPMLGWKRALPLSLIPAAVVCALSGSGAFDLFTFPLICLLAEFRMRQPELPSTLLIPGALIPLIVLFPRVFTASDRSALFATMPPLSPRPGWIFRRMTPAETNGERTGNESESV